MSSALRALAAAREMADLAARHGPRIKMPLETSRRYDELAAELARLIVG